MAGSDLVLSSVSDPQRSVTIPGIGYGALSEYRLIQPGDYVVGLTPKGSSGTPTVNLTLNAMSGESYTLAAVTKAANQTGLSVLTDDLTPPEPGDAKLRIIGAAPSAPTLDVRGPGGDLALGLPYAGASGYRDLPRRRHHAAGRPARRQPGAAPDHPGPQPGRLSGAGGPQRRPRRRPAGGRRGPDPDAARGDQGRLRGRRRAARTGPLGVHRLRRARRWPRPGWPGCWPGGPGVPGRGRDLARRARLAGRVDPRRVAGRAGQRRARGAAAVAGRGPARAVPGLPRQRHRRLRHRRRAGRDVRPRRRRRAGHAAARRGSLARRRSPLAQRAGRPG